MTQSLGLYTSFRRVRCRKTMIKPTVQQVREYADSIGFDIDAEYFIAKNEAVGWMVGSRKNAKPMVSWKGCIRTWHIAAKRRQKATEATVGEKITRQRTFKPTVFVQCVKGPTTGRYLPIILPGSHLEDLPKEQYVAAAVRMCKQFNKTDGTRWVVRADEAERQLILERAASSQKGARSYKKKHPLAMGKEVRKQIKKLEDDLKF